MGRSVATQPPPPEEGERGARVPASRGNAGGAAIWQFVGAPAPGGHQVQGQAVRDFKGMANPQRLRDMVI